MQNREVIFSQILADPDLVERLKTGAKLADAPPQTWYGGGTEGYTDWPVLDSSAP